MLDPTTVHNILERMRTEDPEFRVFGARTHQYQLGPTVSESELQQFEAKYNIRLPDEYRHFLKYIGNTNGLNSERRMVAINAGAGPYYGLLPFAEAAYDCRPDQPFPLTEEDDSPEGVDFSGEIDHDKDPEFPGLIQIGYEGCDNYAHLVVNGSSYGTIWNRGLYNLYVTRLSFDDWYIHWLNNLTNTAIPVLYRERTMKQVQIGMSKEEIIALCGGDWEHRVTPYSSTLSSPDYATQFELDEQDKVKHIINHAIYFRRPS